MSGEIIILDDGDEEARGSSGPSEVIVLDFETYYDSAYGLKKLTTAEYIRDPRFEVVGVGMLFPGTGNRADEAVWLNEPAFREFLDQGGRELLNQAWLVGHHDHFDGKILKWHFGVSPAFWLDTMLMSRPFFGTEVGGSLASLAKRFGLEDKGTEVVKALGKHAWQFTPEEYAEYGEYCKKDCRITWELLKRLLELGVTPVMLPEDGGGLSWEPGFPLDELRLIDKTIRMFTEPMLELDVPRAQAFQATQVKKKQELLDAVGVERVSVMSNDKFAALLQSVGVDPPTKPSPKQRDENGDPIQIWAFAAKDVEFQVLADHPDERVQALMEARIENKSTTNITRVGRLLTLAKTDPTIPLYLKYAGAHTLRWAGGDKLNPQNFERVDEAEGKGVIRQCLMAPAGYRVVVVDSAQIEARGSAWLAGQEDLVQAFTLGRDVYSEFASVAYGRPVDGKTKACSACDARGIPAAMKKGACTLCGGRSDAGLLYPDDEGPRRVGKVCILGLGYSMGRSKLASQMLSGPMGMKPIRFTMQEVEAMGVDLDRWNGDTRFCADVEKLVAPPDLDKTAHMAVCAHLVQRYRARNQALTKFWWDVAPEILDAMLQGQEIPLGPLTTMSEALILPSGLPMRYPDLKYTVTEVEDEEGNIVKRDHWSYWSGRERTFIHGGLLFENIVQALSRQVVAEQMLAISDLDPDYAPVNMSHDEIVFCVPEEKAEKCLRDAIAVMKVAPAWAKGWPLDAEGGIGESYGEAK